MDELLKKAMTGMDNEEIVPKHTKRTSEEETTFVRLSKVDVKDKEKKRVDVKDKEKKRVKPNPPEDEVGEKDDGSDQQVREREMERPFHPHEDDGIIHMRITGDTTITVTVVGGLITTTTVTATTVEQEGMGIVEGIWFEHSRRGKWRCQPR